MKKNTPTTETPVPPDPRIAATAHAIKFWGHVGIGAAIALGVAMAFIGLASTLHWFFEPNDWFPSFTGAFIMCIVLGLIVAVLVSHWYDTKPR